jgi:hypothetical protein
MPLSRLDGLLSDFDVEETHVRRVGASPSAALAAVRTATPGEMPVVPFLYALRSAPALLRRGRGRGLSRARATPMWEQMLESGFVSLVDEEDEIVLGYAGRPWKLSGGVQAGVTSAEEWKRFSAPGYVKAVMGFRAQPADGGALLTTETRVRATDEAAGRLFRRYWRVIRLGSVAIRRSWLRAAAHRAEAG